MQIANKNRESLLYLEQHFLSAFYVSEIISECNIQNRQLENRGTRNMYLNIYATYMAMCNILSNLSNNH